MRRGPAQPQTVTRCDVGSTDVPTTHLSQLGLAEQIAAAQAVLARGAIPPFCPSLRLLANSPLQEALASEWPCHTALPSIASCGADEFRQVAAEPLGSITLHGVAHAAVHE